MAQNFTQPLVININSCPLEGVYLRWLSPLGNLEGWLFSGSVDQKTDIRNATSYQPAPGRRTVAVRRPGYAPVTLYAGHLDTQQVQALSSLLDSPQVYVQDASGQLTPVFVASNGAQFTPKDGRHELSLEIEPTARQALSN